MALLKKLNANMTNIALQHKIFMEDLLTNDGQRESPLSHHRISTDNEKRL